MATFKVRRGTAAEWVAANPVLANGEPGFEKDTGMFKLGDGVSAWSELEYFLSESALKATFVGMDQRSNTVLTDHIRAMKGGGVGIGAKAAVALRFDDWQAAFKANIYTLLKNRGLPAGYAHISRLDQQPDWTAGVIWADIKDWWRNGIEVWSHGTDHKDPSPQGYDGLVDQIVNSKAEIEAQGLPVMGWMQPGATPLTAETPYGTNFLSLSDYATTDAGRLITATYGLSCGDTFGKYRIIPTNVAYGLAHFTVSDGATLAQAKLYIDNAIAQGMGVQLMTHAGNLGGLGMSLTDYTALLDYIVAKRDAGLIEVMTPTGLALANRTTVRQNLLIDGSFATSSTGTSSMTSPYQGWVAGMTVETSGGHTGANFLRLTSTVSGLLVQRLGGAYNQLGVQQIGVNGGTMELRAWVRSNGTGTTTARVLLQDYDDASRLSLDVQRAEIGTAWKQIHVPFSFPTECNRLTFAFGRAAGDGIDWDDMEIVPV